jgi:hypothetical protein
MAAISILRRRKGYPEMAISQQGKKVDWTNVAAGSALVVGGFLLLTEKKRAGMAVAAAGTALALIGQEDTVRAWWKQFPLIVDQVQLLVGQVHDKMNEFAAKRDSLNDALNNAVEEGAALWRED